MTDHNKPYVSVREDLAKIIAQETSGLEGALPENDDYDLADSFIKIINGEVRHTMPRSVFKSLLNDMV